MILSVKGKSLTRYFTLVNFTFNLSLGVLGFLVFRKGCYIYCLLSFLFLDLLKKCRISVITSGTLTFD